MTLFRSVIRLETLFVTLRQMGLSTAIPGTEELRASQRLTELLEQLREVNQDLDWELTSEIVRLREAIAMLLGPEGIKVHMAKAVRRDGLRNG